MPAWRGSPVSLVALTLEPDAVTDEPLSVVRPAKLSLGAVPVLVVGDATCWVSACDVLAVKRASPPYWAVIECEPEERLEVVRTALPDASTATAPRTVGPSLNVTVPVGVPAPEVDASTVAVNVTACPACVGLRLDTSDVVVPTVVGVVEVDVGASWPCALVSSGAAAAVLFSRGRPYMSWTVRRTL